MPNLQGQISRGEPGRLQEQLEGKVWLGQKKGQWPITLLTSESQVITYLADPDATVWEYQIEPVKRVTFFRPAPYLTEYEDG